jgi:acyl-CoA thioesterase
MTESSTVDRRKPAGAAEHALDQAVALEIGGDGRFHGVASPAYWNFAGPFGGATAAVLLQAVLRHERRTGRPLAQTTNYCAAIADAPFAIEVRLERDGRSTQHWNLTLTQNGQVAATGSVVTGAERPTWGHQIASPPAAPRAGEVAAVDQSALRGWMKNYEMRYAAGSPAERESVSRENPGGGTTKVWMRDEPPRPLDYVALTSMADAFAPRIMLVRGEMSPAATVTMSTYFLADEAEVREVGARSILGVANPRLIAHGFHDQSAELWSDAGRLLAVSHQLVWFKE